LHYTLRPAEIGAQSSKSFILETTRDPQSLQPKLATLLADDPIYERENNFKSQVAMETRLKAIWAMVLSWIVMVGYLWFRFKNVSYGFAAVVALVHDVLVALSAVAVAGWLGSVAPRATSWLLIDDFKIDLTIVTAFMTIIGFSVNDTIVIFDRIREIKGKAPYVTAEMINQSVNQCMGRTILTSLTVIIVLSILFTWGGPGVHGFSFAMLIGCLSGTYSTIFIAAPILVMFAGKPAAASPKGVQFQGAPARA
jgi:SecD/SecF fusion protein